MTISNIETFSSRISLPSAYPAAGSTISLAPVFAYPGGKARLSRTFLPHFPQIGGTFCDVFAGRGNVFFAAVASTLTYAKWWVNDVRTSKWFDTLLTCGDKVEVVERNRSNYERLSTTSESAEAILNEPRLTYSGGGWAAGYGSDKNIVCASTYKKRLLAAQKLMLESAAIVSNWDYKTVLQSLGPGDFVYLDPPYKGASVRSYHSSDIRHGELVDILKSAKFQWALSGYPDPLYLLAFGPPTWQKVVPCAMSINRRTDVRTECLWLNPGRRGLM